MTLPSWHRLEPVEVHTLLFDKSAKSWAGRVEAEVRLAVHNGRWLYASRGQCLGGDYSGFDEPLGFWGDAPRRSFPDRLEALKAGIERIRAVHHEERLTPRVKAFLADLLEPQQADLFA